MSFLCSRTLAAFSYSSQPPPACNNFSASLPFMITTHLKSVHQCFAEYPSVWFVQCFSSLEWLELRRVFWPYPHLHSTQGGMALHRSESWVLKASWWVLPNLDVDPGELTNGGSLRKAKGTTWRPTRHCLAACQHPGFQRPKKGDKHAQDLPSGHAAHGFVHGACWLR